VCGLAALLIDIGISAGQLHAVLHGALVNPDSYMRLVRLQDIVHQHLPLHVVARDNAGAGTVLHWSHLLDSILLLLATPLIPWCGTTAALRWAGVALGPLSAGLLGVAVAWATAPLSLPAWRWTAAVSSALALPIVGYAIPGVVHHHVLLVLAATMSAGWAGRAGTNGMRAGLGLGAWTAFGLWLSPEVMPPALLAFGAVGLGWMLSPGERNWSDALAAAGTTLALLVAATLAVDPPLGGYGEVAIDRLSIAWLLLACLGAAAGWGLWALDRLLHTPRPRAVAGGAVALAAAAAWLAMFPAVMGGAEGVLDSVQANAFAGIAEMQPVATLDQAVLYLLGGAFAVLVALILAAQRCSLLWLYAATGLGLLLLEAAAHKRFSAYPAAAGAAAMPVALSLITAGLAARPPLCGIAARLGVLLGVLAAPLLASALGGKATATAGAPAGQCDLQAAAPMLAPFPGTIVLADVNDSPELLYRTPVLTIGSLYHRDPAGYLRLRAAWRSTLADAVPPEVQATGATLVLFCRHAPRNAMLTGAPHDTLWDRLASNHPPAWLHPLPAPPGSGYELFSVVATGDQSKQGR
jgi:hypothetical protein